MQHKSTFTECMNVKPIPGYNQNAWTSMEIKKALNFDHQNTRRILSIILGVYIFCTFDFISGGEYILPVTI